MNKPNNYENTKAYSSFETLPAGCYVCKIMKVEEAKSKTGKEMVVVYFDIAEGDFKEFFAKSYKEDTREDKKWRGVTYILTEDADGNTSRSFKSFMDSVKQSNKGWNEVWGDGFCQSFKDKLVGGLFRREEYAKQDGGTTWSTKLQYFDTVERVKSGKSKTPADKPLINNSNASATAASGNGWMNIPDGLEDEGLPF